MRYTRWLRLMNDQNPPFVPFSIALLITASLALLEARMGSLLILAIAFGGFVVAATVRGRAAVIGACAGSTLAGLSMLVLAPDPEWVRKLPNGKLPDRSDFFRYAGDRQGRIRDWSAAAAASAQMADEFAQWLQSPDPARVDPL